LLQEFEFTQETLALMLGWYAVFIASLTVHEAGHALAAWKLGDPTAYDAGQVTLNPLPHIEREPLGTILVPILTFFTMGWMMGWASAPYDPYWAIRHPGRAVAMAMAGPAGNLLLLIVATVGIVAGFHAGWFVEPEWATEGWRVLDSYRAIFYTIVEPAQPGMAVGAAKLVSMLFTLNLLLMLFNLIPVPPLDGSAWIRLIVKHETASRFYAFMAQPMFMILGLIVAINIFRVIIGLMFRPTLDLLWLAAP
jgi:Zn-dependent protease